MVRGFGSFLCILLFVLCGDAIPAGFMTFFDTLSCPTGWQQPPETMGRLILSVASASEAGYQVNSPLSEQEVRTHTHTFNVSVSLPSRDITAILIPCCNDKGACAGTYHATGKTNASSGEVPYTQLILCELMQDNSDAVPAGTIGFFPANFTSCPSGWDSWSTADGRFLIAGYSYDGLVESQESPIKAGSDVTHSHTFKSYVQTDEVQYFSDSACCNDVLAQSNNYTISGTAASAASGIPYISLLTCSYDQQSFTSALPSGTLLFNKIACTPGWNISIEAAGRFIVSNPQGGTPGVSFGGKSIEPAASTGPSHGHSYQGNLTLTGCGVDLIDGITAKNYAAAETYLFNDNTQQGDIGLPFIAMPLCIQLAGKEEY